MSLTIDLTRTERTADDLEHCAKRIRRSLRMSLKRAADDSVNRLLRRFDAIVPRVAMSVFPHLSRESITARSVPTTPAATLLRRWQQQTTQARPPLVGRVGQNGSTQILPSQGRFRILNGWNFMPLRSELIVAYNSLEGDDQNFWKFRPKWDIWEKLEPLPMRRSGHRLIWLQNGVYSIGGCHPDQVSQRASSFYWNLDNEQWFILRGPKWQRCACQVINLRDVLYVIGGFDPTTSDTVSTIEYHDPCNDIWLNAASLPHATSKYISATVHNNRIWMLTSTRRHQMNSAMGLYNWDPRHPKWIMEMSTPPERTDACIFSVGENLYITGGEETSILRYDDRARQWDVTKHNIWHQRYRPQTVNTGGKVLIYGGCDRKGFPYLNGEVFSPQQGVGSVNIVAPNLWERTGLQISNDYCNLEPLVAVIPSDWE